MVKEKNYIIIEFKAEKAFGEFNTIHYFFKWLQTKNREEKLIKDIKTGKRKASSFIFRQHDYLKDNPYKLLEYLGT